MASTTSFTWREEITECLTEYGETWDDVEASTLTDNELDALFHQGYGPSLKMPFTLWTKRRVYFNVECQGMEYCESVLRHPVGEMITYFKKSQ